MTVNLHSVVDEARFGALQKRVVLLCALIMMVDGYDLGIMGVALPAIITHMQVDASVAGAVASCALVGMMLGAMCLGALADKIGRVANISLCVVVFSVFTAAAGFADSPWSLGTLRFIAGLGLGGVLPSIVAAVSEFSPKPLRSRLTMLMFAAYPVGGMLAALVGRQFLESHGWQMVFYVAIIPLLLVPFIVWGMPESMAVLRRKGDVAELRKLAKALDPVRCADPQLQVELPDFSQHDKAPVVRLFKEGRALGTWMLWVSMFSGLFLLYALHSWLTKLMGMAGHTVSASLTFLMLLNIGSVVGSLGGGWLADRCGVKPVLLAMLMGGAASIAALGHLLDETLLGAVIFMIGVTAAAAQGMCYTFASQYYPVDIRSTGVGMASGMGRVGGITAPIIIGVLIMLELPFAHNFHVIAAFAMVQAIAMLLIKPSAADVRLKAASSPVS